MKGLQEREADLLIPLRIRQYLFIYSCSETLQWQSISFQVSQCFASANAIFAKLPCFIVFIVKHLGESQSFPSYMNWEWWASVMSFW